MKPYAKSIEYEVVLVLHNIRSVHNVGAIMRSADAMGVSQIVFTGYTPTPIDRFGRERADFMKASLGAERSVQWTHSESFASACSMLRSQGFVIIGVEQSARAIDVRHEHGDARMALVFGNEVDGLTNDELSWCDRIVEIPMFGSKESLNVSVAAGIALFVILHMNLKRAS